MKNRGMGAGQDVNWSDEINGKISTKYDGLLFLIEDNGMYDYQTTAKRSEIVDHAFIVFDKIQGVQGGFLRKIHNQYDAIILDNNKQQS